MAAEPAVELKSEAPAAPPSAKIPRVAFPVDLVTKRMDGDVPRDRTPRTAEYINIKLVLPDGAPVSAIVPLLSQFRREGGVLLGSHAKLVTEFEEGFERTARAATIIQRAIRKYRGAQQEGKPDLDEKDELAESEQKIFRCRIKEGELRIHQDFLMVKPGSVNIAADVLLYVFPHPDQFQRFQEFMQSAIGMDMHANLPRKAAAPAGPIVGPDGQPVPKWMLLQKFDDVAVGGQDSFSKLFSDLETKENRATRLDARLAAQLAMPRFAGATNLPERAVKEIFTDLVPFAVVDNIVQRSGAQAVVQDTVQLTGNIT